MGDGAEEKTGGGLAGNQGRAALTTLEREDA
jgi:hypothetical protein